MLLDSARLQKADSDFYNKIHSSEELKIYPLYTEEDSKKTVSLFSAIPINKESYLLNDIKIKFINVGHVLGSAMILLEIDGLKILYTGDIGRSKQLLLNPPEFNIKPDYLIIETTYGNKDHESIENIEDKLAEIIKEAFKNKSRILIPGFALERTQEIIYLIDKLRHRDDIPKIPVYVDSPMSVNITSIFNKYLYSFNFNNTFSDYSRKDGDPFGYDYIHYLSTKEESQTLNDKKGPMIIISASGMCEGGRILHHLRYSLEREDDIVLIVGYQTEGTLGRRLKDGEKAVKIFGIKHNVYCKVINMDFFSAHAGMSDLLFYVKTLNPEKGIFLVHGENQQRKFFNEVLKKEGYKNIFLPEYNEEFDLL